MPPLSSVEICFVVDRLDHTSVPSIVVNLARKLRPSVRDVTIVSLVQPTLDLTDIRVVTVDIRRRPLFLGAFSLGRTLRNLNPDVVISNVNGANLTTALACLLSGLKAKFVPVEQNMFSLHDAFDRGRGLRVILTGLLYRRADRIIGVSEGVSDDLRESFPALADKVSTLTNPINAGLSELRSAARKRADHPWLDRQMPVIVNLANLHPRKDHETLVRAFAELRRKVDAYLIVIGDNSTPHFRDVQALAHELDVGEFIDFVGFQTNPYPFLTRSDVFVLTSVQEGFGMAIVEAMAVGLPVVVTDCPSGPAEIVEEGVSGFLTPVGDSGALAGRLYTVLTDDELRLRMGRKASRRAEHFSLEVTASRYAELLCEVTANGCRHPVDSSPGQSDEDLSCI